MGTRAEQLQAAVKAKLATGPITSQPLTNTPAASTALSSAAKAATPAVAAPISNVASSAKSASSVSPQIAAEVQRKAAAGIALTNPTAETQSLYNAAVKQNQAAVTAPKTTAPAATAAATAAPTAAVAQSSTNYVQQGGQTLNDLLYLKKSYESGKTGAAAYAGQYYNQLDPNTAAAVKNMNAAQLEQYIAGLGSGSATSGQTAQQATPAVATKDYNALAQAQYDRELAALLAGAQAQETELNRRYDYANQVTQDNRQLETATFNRNNAPAAWDGSTGYQAAMMDRNRSIEDHYTQEGLTDAVAAAYSQANAFRNQAGNYLTTTANQLQSADQQLAMQEAGLTGTYNGQQTLAAQQQAYNQAADTRNYNYQVSQDQFNNGVTMAQLTGYLPNGQATSAQQQLQLQNLWTVAEQTGVIPDALATLYGLPKGTQTQSAMQAAAQIAISQQNANTSQASAQSSITNNNFSRLMDVWKATGFAPSGLEAYGVAPGEQWYQEAAQIKENSMTPQQVLTNIRELYQEPVYTTNIQGKQEDTGKTRLTTDPTKRKQMFNNVVDSGLSNTETMQVLSSLGYSKEEITKLYNEGLASGGQ